MANNDASPPLCLPSHPNLRVLSAPPGDPRGRYAVSSRRLPAGSVVTRSAPLAYGLRSGRKDERCARCLSKAPRLGGGGARRLARCSRCGVARYCGRECQRADYPYHGVECRRGGGFPDAVRDEVELLLRTNAALASSAKDSGEGGDDFDGGCRLLTGDGGGADIAAVRCVPAHFWAMARSAHVLDPLDRLAVDAAARHCPGWSAREAEDALRTFRSNNFGVLDDMLDVIAGGVYPHGAILNHSCDPNCVLRYEFHPTLGPVMVVAAVRDIPEGRELTHSYVDLVNVTPVRRERLKQIHGFECQCPRCKGECRVILPRDFAEMPDSALVEWILAERNPHSSSTAGNVGTEDIESIEIDEAMTRTALASGADPGQARADATSTSEQKREEANAHMGTGDLDRELRCLKEAVAVLSDRTVTPPLSVELYSARGALLSSLIVSGRTSEALEVCKAVVAFLGVTLGHIPNHPLLGLQLFTLGDLCEASGEANRAREAHAWARDVLRVSHGRGSELVGRLEGTVSY